MVQVGDNVDKTLKLTEEALKKSGTPYDKLTPVQLEKRYPMVKYPHVFTGLVDHNAGILRADRALIAYWVRT